MLCGDVHPNPGPAPKKKIKYPCGCGCGGSAARDSIGCSKCTKYYRRKCLAWTISHINSYVNKPWTCKRCDIPVSTIKTPKDNLKILVWNAGGLCEKSGVRKTELAEYLESNKIDIALIQETNLKAGENFTMKGYSTHRDDRKNARSSTGIIKGGGVVSMIKSGIQHTLITEKMVAQNDKNTDIVAVKIEEGSKPITCINVYVPPITDHRSDSRQQNFDPEKILINKSCLIAGDFNAHSRLWDKNAANTDKVGDILEDWIMNKGLQVLTSGEATRINPATGGKSAPDAAFGHDEIGERCEARILDDQLGSDHFPIVYEIDIGKRKYPNPPKKKWLLKKCDWRNFRELVTKSMNEKEMPEHPGEATKWLNNIILYGMRKSCPKGYKKTYKPWFNDECKAARLKRKEAAQKDLRNPINRENWRQEVIRTRQVIAKAKQKNWRDFICTLNARTEPGKVWRVIRGLDGRSNKKAEGQNLQKDGKIFKTSAKKAGAFIKEYKKVSSINIREEDKEIIRQAQDDIRKKCTTCENEAKCCSEFSFSELRTGMNKLQMGKCAGEDEIPNEVIVNLPEKGEKALLKIINKCYKLGFCPKEWKTGIIIPIPKPGKNAKEITSYRPICLTSCLAKLMERMIKERLMFHLESENSLCDAQAGFRSLRSTEDQVLRITQRISDNWNKKPGHRTVLCLVDFARAFDTVWKDGLIFKLLTQHDVPVCLIRWLKNFLSDRKAKVQFENAKSKPKTFTAGVPQGSVLSPTLFLIFINDILNGMSKDIEASLFADDLALWCSHPNIDVARSKLQKAIDKLCKWTDKWHMKVNTSKCVTTFFTKATYESKYNPIIKFKGEEFPVSKTPTFLGIKFDRTLSFKDHIEQLKTRLTKRNSVLRAIQSREWGSNKEDLRTVYLAYIQSSIDYCGAAWQTSVADSNIKKLQTIQNAGARAITGCTKSCPNDLLLNEANLLPISESRKTLATIAYERTLRLPNNNPVKATSENTQRQRLIQNSWRKVGKMTSQKANLENLPREQLVNPNTIPPWNTCNVFKIFPDLIEPCKKNENPLKLKKLAIETISKHPETDYKIWTDGSAKEGYTNAGSGIFIQEKGQHNDGVRLEYAAGKIASSYRAEMLAIREALIWLTENINETETSTNVLLLTDSKSALQRLASGPNGVKLKIEAEVWNHANILERKGVQIILQWVPGHVGVWGNEQVDEVAKSACQLPQQEIPIDLNTAKATVKRYVSKEWRKGVRHQTLLTNELQKPPNNKEQHLSRRDRIYLSQIRTGEHCPIFNSYLFRIGKKQSPACRKCGSAEENWEHILKQCKSYDNARKKHFRGIPDRTIAWTHPAKVIEFLRESDLI